MKSAALAVLLLSCASATAAEIHRCPQPDGTTRFQDRPCAATPAPAAGAGPSGATAEPPARPADPRRSRAGSSPGAVPPPPLPPPTAPLRAPPIGVGRAADAIGALDPAGAGGAGGPAESRADYIARNAARCEAGDRRACAAVTCERSGRLDSPACQEAVGYLRGPGWELRPRSDLFDPARASDEFTLTCRGGSRRATLTRARGTDVYAWPTSPAGDTPGTAGARAVPRAELPGAAREFCATR